MLPTASFLVVQLVKKADHHFLNPFSPRDRRGERVSVKALFTATSIDVSLSFDSVKSLERRC